MKHQNIKVIKNEEKPETPEILAASLIKISDAFEALRGKGNLDDDAIACLLKNMRGMNEVSKNDIKLVLGNLPRLKSYYIRK